MQYKIKKDASEFRNSLGIGNTEAIKLESLLIKLNIITVFRDLSEGFSGMSVMASDKKFMLVNSAHSIGRQHFTICHELYHLFFDDNFVPHICNTGIFNKENNKEFLADVFASYFLIPDDGVLSLIPDDEYGKDKIKIETILKIEQYFSCSRAALVNRLKDLNLISRTSDIFNQNIRNTAKQYGYSTELYEKGNGGLVFGDFGTLAKQLFDSEKISEGHYTSLMHTIGIDVFNTSTDGDSN